MDPWPFDQPKNCGVITTTHVMRGGHDITHVFHDEDDHGWQFHYSGAKDVSDAMLVGLSEVVKYDPSILEVAKIPPGWMATRSARGEAWTISKNPRSQQS